MSFEFIVNISVPAFTAAEGHGLTLLIPKGIGQVPALLLDPLLQAPLPQAKVAECAQGEPPLCLPQVPTGGDQSW